MCYILHSDWSLLLLVNTHGSFHCKQSIMLLAYKVVYTVNKAVYKKHHFTPSCSTYNRIYNFLSVPSLHLHFSPSLYSSSPSSTLLLPPLLFFSLLYFSSPSQVFLSIYPTNPPVTTHSSSLICCSFLLSLQQLFSLLGDL